MTPSNDQQISRRSAVALAAALAGTAVTAAFAYGGLAHWRTQSAPAQPAAQIVQQAPAPQFVSEAD